MSVNTSKTISIASKDQLNRVFLSSPIVVANIFDHTSRLSQQLSIVYESLSYTHSRTNKIAFVKIDFCNNADLAKSHGVSEAPGFLVFHNAQVKYQALQANTCELKKFTAAIAHEAEILEPGLGRSLAAGLSSPVIAGPGSSAAAGPSRSAAAGSSSPAADAVAVAWRGAEIPNGSDDDLTDEIEIKGLELLNTEDGFGTVRTLFDSSKPSRLANKKDTTTKDWIQSCADDQMLLFIPFQSTIKLRCIQLTSIPSADVEGGVCRPHVLYLYNNHPQNMDFAEADRTKPTQIFRLGPQDWNDDGTATITVRFVKYQRMSTLIIYFQKGDGVAEFIQLDRVRLFGEAGTKREMGILKKVDDDD